MECTQQVFDGYMEWDKCCGTAVLQIGKEFWCRKCLKEDVEDLAEDVTTKEKALEKLKEKLSIMRRALDESA